MGSAVFEFRPYLFIIPGTTLHGATLFPDELEYHRKRWARAPAEPGRFLVKCELMEEKWAWDP